jgi:hypothetical protein
MVGGSGPDRPRPAATVPIELRDGRSAAGRAGSTSPDGVLRQAPRAKNDGRSALRTTAAGTIAVRGGMNQNSRYTANPMKNGSAQ